ncbi:MAG: PD-(D/E)XK nuclease family protein, partial [Cyanobacteria bacterium P01_D01_bin.73]
LPVYGDGANVRDLLVLDDKQALIIDWKTAVNPRDRPDLKNDWQTKLYLYLLAETSPQPIESLKMVYWFVRDSKSSASKALSKEAGETSLAPKVIQFNYTAEWHQSIHNQLEEVLKKLSQWRQQFIGSRVPFPTEFSKDLSSNTSPKKAFYQGKSETKSNGFIEVPKWESIPEIRLEDIGI